MLCPVCKTSCGRTQELDRHILFFHLPYSYHCPHSPCPWRGRRKDRLKAHLRVHPGSDPEIGPYEGYETRLVLDFIKDGIPIETVAGFTLHLVAERARELRLVKEWENLWGG